eukprot:scaffold4163_cov425-Prasinococcus_capsulatus_cf.AAC.14
MATTLQSGLLCTSARGAHRATNSPTIPVGWAANSRTGSLICPGTGSSLGLHVRLSGDRRVRRAGCARRRGIVLSSQEELAPDAISEVVPEEGAQKLPQWQMVLQTLTNAFPVWIACGALLGLAAPAAVSWFNGEAITVALILIMVRTRFVTCK